METNFYSVSEYLYRMLNYNEAHKTDLKDMAMAIQPAVIAEAPERRTLPMTKRSWSSMAGTTRRPRGLPQRDPGGVCPADGGALSGVPGRAGGLRGQQE